MTFAENILSVMERTSSDEHEEGMNWYNKAYQFALELSPGNPWRGAGVISALSAQEKWDRNVINAQRAFDTGIVSGNTGVMNSQGQRILDGEFALDVLNGPKVRAFAAAIATNGQSDIAVIDRHAHDIAMGRVFGDSERKIGVVLGRKMAEHYLQVALECGIAVAQTQAITWVRWRNEKGIK